MVYQKQEKNGHNTDIKIDATLTKDDQEKHEQSLIRGWGCRHQQCVILFLSLTTAYSIRSCMGVALVAMTTHTVPLTASQDTGHVNYTHKNFTETSGKHVSNLTGDLLVNNENNSSDLNNYEGILHKLMLVQPYPEFKWSKKVQDTILSSFFWGYMCLQIPAGMLVHRYGSRHMLVTSMSTSCVLFIILPWMARYGGWVCMVILRMVQGLTQACVFPSIHSFFGKWAPLQERGRMSALVYGGQALGTVLGLPITGFIAASGMGWPGIFRFYGLLCGIFGVVIYLFLADTPAKHPNISAAERKYIEDELGDNKKPLTVPWKSIIRSRGVWASICGHIGQSWGGTILFTEMPSYMDKVMRVNIKANGVLTALPFMFMWVANFLFSYLSDILINRRLLTVTKTRKLMNSIGSFFAALGLILICIVPKDIYIVEPLLIFICTFKIAAHMGFQVINIDIAPNFAGTIMSISNFCASGISSFGPVISGLLLTEPANSYHWNRVFLLTAGFYIISNLLFVIFATADKAEWNEPEAITSNKTEDDEETYPMMENIKKNNCDIKS